jgi:N-glycosylase/DNA lyase
MKTEFCQDKVIIHDAPCTDISLIFDCGQAFRFDKDETGTWCGTAYGKFLKISQSSNTIILYGSNEDDYKNIWYDYFDFSRDYDLILKSFCCDKLLEQSVHENYGIRVLKQEKWETLCSFIISQNNNIPRIKGIIKRMCENFGNPIENDYTFPTAEKIASLSLDDLAPLRAGFRNKYILDAANKVAAGKIDLESLSKLPTDEAALKLMEIKGVGKKVAQCVMLFAYGREDAFPVDVWVKRVMTLYPDDLPQSVLPYRGVAQQYLFHYIRKHPEIAEKI